MAYFSSAGNSARDSYETAFSGVSDAALDTVAGFANISWHDFDPGAGVDTLQAFTLANGESVRISFQWDEPYFDAATGSPGSASDVDFWILDAAGTSVVANGINGNIGGDPVEFVTFTNTTGSAATFNIAISLFDGPAPNLIKYIDFSGGTSDAEYHTFSGTSFGHPSAEGGQGVGAAFWGSTPAFGVTPPELESFSSAGGTPILFEDDGTRLATPEIRNRVDFTAPDGGNTTFFGNDIGFDADSDPNFFGTSAAAPNAAALAALMLEANPSATPTEIYTAMQNSAIDIVDREFVGPVGVGLDDDSGAGLIQATAALNEIIALNSTQTVLNEGFETDGNGTRYTTSTPEFFNVFGEFFKRTDGSDIDSSYEVTGFGGSFFFAGAPGVGAGSPTLDFTGLDISGLTNLQFSIDVAEDDVGSNQDWNADSSLIIEYQIDGGGFQNLFAIENDGSEFNGAPLVDTDFDGTGDGTEITDAFQTFMAAIAGTGSTLDLRISFNNLSPGGEDAAIDNIVVTGNAVPPSAPSAISVSIADDSVSENGGTSTITVTLDQAAIGDTVITLASDDTSEGTVPTSVIVLDGQTSATATFTAVDDAAVDGTQTVTVTASATGLTSGGDTIDVTDDDVAPVLQLSINPGSISENGGFATGTVTRTGSTDGSLTVILVSNDQTEATVPTTVVINDGQASANFNINAVDDGDLDGTQTVTISADSTGFAAVTETIDVTDDEVPGIQITIDRASISENGDFATGTVTRIGLPTDADLTVNLTSSDTSEATVPFAVVIQENQTSASFNIFGVDDSILDGTQTVFINAISGGNSDFAALDVTDDEVAAPTLISEFQPNPDGADPANVSFELSGEAGAAFSGWILGIEGDGSSVAGIIDRAAQVSGTFDSAGLLTVTIPDLENPSFTVVLVDSFTGTVGTDIDVDNDGTADDLSTFGNVLDAIGIPDSVAHEAFLYGAQLGGQDFSYTGAEPELVFRDASRGDWYAVNVAGTPGGPVFDISGTDVTAAIFDNDPTAGTDTFGAINPTTAAPTGTTLVIAATDADKAEGDSGTTAFTFTVTRSGDTSGATDVDFAVTSSAADADDFGGALPSGTISFAANETTQTITVNVSGDTDIEPDEIFTVSLSNPTGGTTINAVSANGTIRNDDGAFAVGDIIITEIMQNPSAVSDSNGEFFEVYNTTGGDIDLNGWTISDNGSDSHTITGSVIVAAGGYAVLGINGDAATNGGVTVDYVYSGINLANGDDEIILTAPNAAEVDRVEYDGGPSFPDPTGASMELEPGVLDASDNDFGANWDAAVQPFGDGDLGTPGAANGAAPPTININEIRIDQTGSDDDEYFELFGTSGASLDGHHYIVIGDGAGGSGVIETVVDLSGLSLGADGLFLAAEDADTLGALADAAATLNFENSDNVTHLLVTGFTGADGDDLDTNDDGTLDITPWTEIVDSVALVETTDGTGDQIYSTTTVGPDGSFVPGHVFRDVDGTGSFQIGGFTAGTDDTPGASNVAPPPPPPPPSTTLIHDIQGTTDQNLLDNQVVTIEAIVVGDFQDGDADGTRNLEGFYVQEEDSDADGNALTSEGIFIFEDGNFITDVNVGDLVQITGTVDEAFGQTQLDAITNITVVSQNNTLPTAAVVDLPNGDLEAYEGMLVSFSDTLTITEMFNLDRFTEIRLTEGGRPQQFTQTNAPDAAGYAAHLADVEARSVVYDDGQSIQNGPIGNLDGFAGFSDANAPNMGDTIDGLSGVLTYGFSEFRVRATQDGANTFTDTNTRETAPADVGGDLKVASLNVLNFFTTIDDNPGSFNGPFNTGPGGTEEPRGAEDLSVDGYGRLDEYNRQLDKLVTTIVAMDADILGLVEIENDPNGSDSLQALVDAVNAVVGAGTYDFVDAGPILNVEGGAVTGDAIKNGFIYKTGTVALNGTHQLLDSSDDSRFDSSVQRPSLAQSFTDIASGESFTAVANHFKSKGSVVNGENATGDGQGNNNPTRTAAAEALVDWLATDPTGTGDTNFLILGDLNAYAMEDPIMAILEGADDTDGTGDDFADLIQNFVGATASSYVFDGQTGTLDYALANAAFLASITGATNWTINSDEADALDYNLNFGRDPNIFEGTTPFRSSDHDPIIVGLAFEANVEVFSDTGANTRTGRFAELDGALAAAATSGLVRVNDAVAIGAAGNQSVAVDDLTVSGATPLDAVFFLSTGVTGFTLSGTTSADVTGNGGDNTINGSDGANTIRSGDGVDTVDGGGGVDDIFGGAGNDELRGGTGNDLLTGRAGNDFLYGDDGDDELFGGADNDDIFGGIGADTISGGTGNDTLRGEDGDDDIDGGTGEDVITGGLGADRILGADGGDDIFGQEGDDNVFAGEGDDEIHGGDGIDTLRGENGNDLIEGDRGNDFILGGAGDDNLRGDVGEDRILGGDGNDSIFGGFDNDTIDGGDGNDTIRGEHGNDLIEGGRGNDIIVGADGEDSLRGGVGEDQLFGQADNDFLFGGFDADMLDAGSGDDTLRGEVGADTLIGGLGDDNLIGGSEVDTFRFSVDHTGSDTVFDFAAGERVELLGFGYANAAAAASDFSQSGTSVIFANGGVTVTFLNASLSDVTDAVDVSGGVVTSAQAGSFASVSTWSMIDGMETFRFDGLREDIGFGKNAYWQDEAEFVDHVALDERATMIDTASDATPTGWISERVDLPAEEHAQLSAPEDWMGVFYTVNDFLV